MKPEKLILDYSKWRCGEGGDYSLGKGTTQLRNKDGYCCCLGQWSLQLGAKEDEITGCGEPNEIKTLIPLFCDIEIEYAEDYNPATDTYEKIEVARYKSTNSFASDCIGINDKSKTTPEEKILELTELLQKHNIELEVINKPVNDH